MKNSYLFRFVMLLCIFGTAANSHFSQYSVKGMPLSFALQVAEETIIQAASFNNKKNQSRLLKMLKDLGCTDSNPNYRCFNRKGVRGQDTLDFLGISDNVRLDALRRYVVGNEQFGVPSVWQDWPPTGVAYPYHIRRADLEKVDKSWTVVKLAGLIADSSEIAVPSMASVAAIIAGCRVKAMKLASSGGGPGVGVLIKDDIKDAANRSNFEACLKEIGRNGKSDSGNITFEDSSGNARNYVLRSGTVEELRTTINQHDYSRLIDFLQQNYEMPLCSHEKATVLVLTATRILQVGGCGNELTFTRENPCGAQPIKLGWNFSKAANNESILIIRMLKRLGLDGSKTEILEKMNSYDKKENQLRAIESVREEIEPSQPKGGNE